MNLASAADAVLPSHDAAEANDTDESELLTAEAPPAESESTEASEDAEDTDKVSLAGAAVVPTETSEPPVDTGISPNDTPEAVANTETRKDIGIPKADEAPAPDVQAMTVQSAGSGDTSQPGVRTPGKDKGVGARAVVESPAVANFESTEATVQQTAAPESKTAELSSNKTAPVEHGDAFQTKLSDTATDGSSETGKTGSPAHASPAPDAGSQVFASALGASPVSQTAAQSPQTQMQMTPTNAVVTASPAETVKIITDAVSSPNDTPERITVQLDPPELGRVSIDFKFDAHGIQHITVTGESPEALRQLRLMHFELTQALERNGLSGQNMTFQQQQSGHQQSQTPGAGSLFDNDGLTAEPSLLTAAHMTADSIRPARTASGGIDIRL
ncbi:flagellar hook-length control protein FliK [uncultured Hyphomonas sp.]|uniref:flagellar hook-length control protein FliK n=1 Tax=uncultured Hyphomonas sp. TaxID=225298 RepID=UPI002AAB63F0|nr:flagellar hook-length control protein FliK [uncultured Hyphomonas sp.]